MFDGIQFRGFAHETVETLARHAGVPVWNGLTDAWHPTQTLADVLTVREEFGRLEGIGLAYVGDGRNNVACSLMVGCAKLGMDVRIVAPEVVVPGAWPGGDRQPHRRRDRRQGDGHRRRSRPGSPGRHAVYTDVWASMGEEGKIGERIAVLRDYKVTRRMMEMTGRREAIFLHCLPAFHNLETEVARQYLDICEVEDEVFEGPQSRVFDQAENRLHTIKAVMVATLGS